MSKKARQSPSQIPALPEKMLAQAFPGGFTIRDEANALTAYAFRNGPLEDLHAGASSPLTSDPKLSRITNAEMKELMVNASERLAQILKIRDNDPHTYQRFVRAYGFMYCRGWNR
jgi:hypothetical protein